MNNTQKQQVMVKLAQVRLAINHVIRKRALAKQADWYNPATWFSGNTTPAPSTVTPPPQPQQPQPTTRKKKPAPPKPGTGAFRVYDQKWLKQQDLL